MLIDGAPMVVPGVGLAAVDDLLPPIANATPAAAPAAARPSRIHLVLPEDLCPGGALDIVTAGASFAFVSAAVGIGVIDTRAVGSGLGFSGGATIVT